MSKSSPLTKDRSSERFVYVTYIATTPDRVWQALIKGELTRQYWGGYETASDWREGSPWQLRGPAPERAAKVVGKVIEIRPPHRLVLTWADPGMADDPVQHSRVAFDIEASDKTVRLTVTHDDFAVGSDMPVRISGGWPRVLSSLKTLLESGSALDFSSGSLGCGSK